MIYTFEHPETQERVDVEMSMNSKHVFFRDGIEWNRVFHAPNTFISDKIDPFSSKQFMDKTNKRDTIASISDRAAELSEMRAEKCGGIDPMKVQKEKEYSAARRGRKIPKKVKDMEITIGKK